jgi:hypothetical protein
MDSPHATNLYTCHTESSLHHKFPCKNHQVSSASDELCFFVSAISLILFSLAPEEPAMLGLFRDTLCDD